MNFVFTFGSYSQHLHRILLNHCGLCNCSWCAWWHCRLFEPCSIFGCSSLQREQLRRIEVGILATARPGGPAKRWIAASGHAPICWTEQQKQHWKKYPFIPVALFFSQVFNLSWKAVKYYVANRTYSRRPCEEPVPRRTTLDDAMASTLEYIQIQFHQFLGKHWRFLNFFTIFMFLQFFFTFLCFCSRAQIPLSFKIDETSQHQGSVTGLDEWVPSSRTACQTHSGSWKQLRFRRQSTRHKSRFWTAAAAVWGEGSKKGVIWIVPPPPFLGGH